MGMKEIEKVIIAFQEAEEEEKDEKYEILLWQFKIAIQEEAKVIVPYKLSEEEKEGYVQTLSEDGNVEGNLRIVSVGERLEGAAYFSSEEEMNLGEETDYMLMKIGDFLEKAYMDPMANGVVINPWGDLLYFKKGIVMSLFLDEPEEETSPTQKRNTKEKEEEEQKRFHDAIEMATELHRGKRDELTGRPKILHIMQMLQVLEMMNASTEQMISAALFDILSCPGVSLSKIAKHFGKEIASDVSFFAENSSESWFMKKVHFMQKIIHADRRKGMILLADVVATLRVINAEAQRSKGLYWRFAKVSPNVQAVFYSMTDDYFSKWESDPDISPVYLEQSDLFKEIFVICLLDEKNKCMYQVCKDGTAHIYTKKRPLWFVYNDALPEKDLVQTIPHKLAAGIEKVWAGPYIRVHDQDFDEQKYLLYKDEKHMYYIDIYQRKLTFLAYDALKGNLLFQMQLATEDSNSFLVEMRLEYGVEISLGKIFVEAFGGPEAPQKFQEFCEKNGLEMKVVMTMGKE